MSEFCADCGRELTGAEVAASEDVDELPPMCEPCVRQMVADILERMRAVLATVPEYRDEGGPEDEP